LNGGVVTSALTQGLGNGSEPGVAPGFSGYRRFRCRTCGKQFNERAGTALNRAQYPSDVIALAVLWRLGYKLSLRDLPEMFLIRGIVFSYEAGRDWEPTYAGTGGRPASPPLR
jgi:hypothetical protein